MRVVWSHRAYDNYQIVKRYIKRKFGERKVREFCSEVRKATVQISHHPDRGSYELLLEGGSYEYRSILINGLSKLVYVAEDDIIHVADFWDCRWEPERITEGL